MILPEAGQRIPIGSTRTGKEIFVSKFGNGSLPVLLIGGVHGNESEGFLLCEKFEKKLENSDIRLSPDVSLFICNRINPDGCCINRRTNQNNVDLNRNLPTRDWNGEFENVKYYPGAFAGSEIESKMMIEMIKQIKPACIISLHSYENAMINFNGPCEDLAIEMSKFNNLPPKGDIGYPTPGSLGTWAGWERKIPTITLEILRDQKEEEVWNQHWKGLVCAIEFYTKNKRIDSVY